jgi:hypothetical protein
MWPGVYARTGLTLACSQREKVGAYAACQCLHWPPFMSCTLLDVPPTWPFRWGLVPYIHTYIRTYIHTYIHTYISRGAAPLCVAGVALGDVHLDYMQGRFAWQAPHWWHLVTYTLISRGTRCGTISRPWRQQLIMTIYQVWLPATGHAERVRKICGFARKSAEHYFGQRKYGEHTIALIEGSAIKDLSGSNVGKKTIRAWWNSKKASETRRET